MTSTLSDVESTFSSWDSCMSEAYCKWPAIVGIIIGSLIVLSLIFCLARCLCFGAECCACCFSCCACCCPSRGRRRRDQGSYQQPPPPPPAPPYQQYPQYSSPPAPYYGQATSYGGPQTATFVTPSKLPAAARYNEDALPVMPSWDNAHTRHVEDEDEQMEMDRLDNTSRTQQEGLLAGHQPDGYAHNDYDPYSQRGAPQTGYQQNRTSQQGYAYNNDQYGSNQQHLPAGGVGGMNAAPYQDYNRQQQYAPTLSPVSTAYAPSTAVPPSYHTREQNAVSPIQSNYNPFPSRRPVQGSWRDV